VSKDNQITPAELIVMKVLWKNHPCTAAVIVDRISEQSEWHFRTIKTLLRNLVRKKRVGYTIDEQDSRVYHYYPLIQEEEYLRQERQQFLQVYYNGDMNNLLVGFLKDSHINEAEAEALRNLLLRRAQDDSGGAE